MLQPALDPNQTYRPIMLQMKCRGSLSFSAKNYEKVSSSSSSLSDDNHTNNNEKSKIASAIKSSLPTCYGIQSRIQPVREYPPMKPHAALRAFTNQTSFYHPDPDDGDEDYEEDENEARRVHQKYSSSSPSSSFGGRHHHPILPKKKKKKNPPTVKATDLPLIVDTKWEKLKKELSQRSDVDVSNFNTSSTFSNTTNRSSSTTTHANKMNFIGSTDIYMLVLRPNHDNHHHKDDVVLTNKKNGMEDDPQMIQHRATNNQIIPTPKVKHLKNNHLLNYH